MVDQEVGVFLCKRKLKLDLKRLANSALANNLTKHLNEYESKVKEMVHGFDLKSRHAREKSRKRLDEFAKQLKRTRGDLEKRVSALVSQEGIRLNKRVGELFNYLKSVAGNEKLSFRAAPSKKKKTKSASKTKKSSPKKRSDSAVPCGREGKLSQLVRISHFIPLCPSDEAGGLCPEPSITASLRKQFWDKL